MSKRTNQGGSVISFVIVGVVLASVVAGGVYLVNQRNKQNTTKQPTTSQPSTTPQGANNKPASQPTPTPANNPSSSTPTSGPQPQPTNGHLPTSGPNDALFQLFALSILVGLATAYVRSQISRRQPVSL